MKIEEIEENIEVEKIEKNRKITKKEQVRVFSEISEFVKKCGINFDIGP